MIEIKDRFQFKKTKNKEIISISKFLRSENRSNEVFEMMLNSLTLEEIIMLKLELADKNSKKALYSFALWKKLGDLCKEAVMRHAVISSRNETIAKTYLGLTNSQFYKYFFKYNIPEYIKNITEKIDSKTKLE